MLQKINLVLMVIVLLAVAAVSVQVLVTQRYNTLALQAITTDLAQMKFEPGAGPAQRDDILIPWEFGDPLDLLKPGLWREAQPDGSMNSDGAYLELLSPDDVDNLTGLPFGTLVIPSAGAAFELTFINASGRNLKIVPVDDTAAGAPYPSEGRWVMQNNLLFLNLDERMPEGVAPLLLVRMEPKEKP